ncbi:MAG TPA: endonuclease domain-containing protein [Dehalococcoidia bacterium]|nr:endonuclease domain-containing protein [Dehalococcoidia bacterium]
MKKGGEGGFRLRLSHVEVQPASQRQSPSIAEEFDRQRSSSLARLRHKQLLGIQFYRQKPIGEYIVDFFAPRARLVVEVDGAQHLGGDHALKDRSRDRYLVSVGLRVLRFNSREVLKECDGVVEAIYRTVAEQLNAKIPPSPPLK